MSESVLIVDASKLKDTPEAFQEYVAEFFSKTKVLGKEVFVASTVLHWDWSREGYGRGKGRAPCHGVDLRRFQKGLGGKDLGEWMRSKKVRGKILWEFFTEGQTDPHWDDD